MLTFRKRNRREELEAKEEEAEERFLNVEVPQIARRLKNEWAAAAQRHFIREPLGRAFQKSIMRRS